MNESIRKPQAMIISQRCTPCCRSAVFQRFRRRRRLPPVHRLPPWGDLWREQTSRLELRSSSPSTERTFVWPPANFSSSAVQHDTSPHHHSQLSDLTVRLYSTTSLKSITLKWWLYHQMFKLTLGYWSVQLCRSKRRRQSFFTLIGQSPHNCGMPLIMIIV